MVFDRQYFAREKAKAKKELDSGKFGNTLDSWYTLEEALSSDCESFGIRVLEPGSKYFIVKLDRNGLIEAWNNIPPEVPRYISESPNDDMRYANFEITKPDGPPWHYYMRYNHIDDGTLRHAMSDPETGRFWEATGPAVKEVLKLWCNSKSYQMLVDLMDEYPGHVFECTAFRYKIGRIPGHNTIVWEARKTY